MDLAATKRFKKIYIEIGNVCNLQCTFCPAVEREKKRMAAQELSDILTQIKPFAEEACFHVMGEPLAHPNFSEFVTIAKNLEVPLEITTNGTLLSANNEAALLDAAIRQTNFSLQSFYDNFPDANPDTYIARIFAFTKRAMRERPDLYINFRLWNLSPGDKQDKTNLDFLAQLEKNFSVTINPNVDSRMRKSKRLVGRLYLHYDTRFEWPSLKSPKIRTSGTCHGARTHVAIHADGTVVPCCLDKEASIPLGNLSQSSFSSIISGARLEKMREGFEAGQLVEDLCQRCQYATRFPTPGNKLACK